MNVKLAIVGSRSFNDYNLLCEIASKMYSTEIISGGAIGADSLAERYAKDRGLKFTAFLPKFKTNPEVPYHPKWFFERNKQIVDASDWVLAFWDGKSKGTKHTIDYAKKNGVPVRVIIV